LSWLAVERRGMVFDMCRSFWPAIGTAQTPMSSSTDDEYHRFPPVVRHASIVET